MVVDSSFLPLLVGISPEAVHVGVEQDQDEGHQQVEDQPDVNHLHVGCVREVVADADEHGRQHQHGGEIYCHDRFKEKILRLKKLLFTLFYLSFFFTK